MSDSSTGQIVGGIAGAVIGGFVAGPTGAVQGFSIGYGIGGAIDPPPGPLIRAPRLDDLTFQSSTYGAPVPRIYGTVGMHGNVIYLENGKYKEVVSVEEQGKGGGGPSVETVAYFATFAVSISEVSPGAAIRKIWLGGKLFYNAGSSDLGTIIQSNKNAAGFTFYDGTQTEPDDRIESVVGVANAESYEGTAYIIFYDLPLEEYGNGLQGCPVKVEAVSDVSSQPVLIEESSVDYAVRAAGTFDPKPYTITNDRCFTAIPGWDSAYPASTTYGNAYADFDLSLEFMEVFVSLSGSDIPPNGLNDVFNKYQDASEITPKAISLTYPSSGYQLRASVLLMGTKTVSDGEIYRRESGVEYSALLPDIRGIGLDESGFSYAVDGTHIYKYSDTMTLISSLPHGVASFFTSGFGGGKLWHSGGMIYLGAGLTPYEFVVFDDELSSVVAEFSLPNVEAASSPYGEFAVEDGVLTRSWADASSGLAYFDRWNVSLLSGSGQALGDVVTELVGQVGIEPDDIDVTDLSSDTVAGYIVTPSDARSALSTLQTAYLFDIVQDGYGLRAVKRGKDPVATIPYGDLGAVAEGSTPDKILKKTREMDTQLPSRMEIRYLDAGREYESGSQYADYPTTAEGERSNELALVLTAGEAAKVADILINAAWIERTKFEFTLPQTYMNLKVSDNVTIQTPGRGYEVRLSSRNEDVGQRLSFTGSLSRPDLYESNAEGGVGVLPDESVRLRGTSTADLIDAPMILNSLDSAGYVAAMRGNGAWSGGSLYRSFDAGQNYTNIQSFVASPAKGQAADTLAESTGTVIERGTGLTLFNLSGDFVSVTEAQMMTGANWCAYGVDGRWELIRYTDATPQADGSIVLSGFIRGHRGTEWATGLHEVGDLVINLSDAGAQFVGAELDRLGSEALYKPVTIGSSVVDATEQPFAYRGVNLRPLSPVIPTSSFNGADWTIGATSRTRYQGSFWVTGVQPQNETVLSYELEIYSGPNVVRTLASSSLLFAYTEAMVLEDFGEAQDELEVAFYQLSETVGRGTELAYTALSGVVVIYSTFNPLTIGANQTLSGGDLTVTVNSSVQQTASSDVGVTSGKFYSEMTINSGAGAMVGVTNDPAAIVGGHVGATSSGWGFNWNGDLYHSGGIVGSLPISYGQASVVGVALDMDSGRVWFSVDGVWDGDPAAGTGEAFSSLTGTVYKSAMPENTAGSNITANFGASPLLYPAPAGFENGFFL